VEPEQDEGPLTRSRAFACDRRAALPHRPDRARRRRWTNRSKVRSPARAAWRTTGSANMATTRASGTHPRLPKRPRWRASTTVETRHCQNSGIHLVKAAV